MSKEFNFIAPKEWTEINKKDFSIYGIADFPDAKVEEAFLIANEKNAFNAVTLYCYGDDDGQIDEMENDYQELQLSLKEQDECGVFPLYWEKKDDLFISVLKPVYNPVLNMVDLFFVENNKLYSFHFNINKDEKNLTLEDLCEKYSHIGYCYNAISKN